MNKNKSGHQKGPAPSPSSLASGTSPAIVDASEKITQEALEKYKELYTYSTDVLLKEQERFNRADEKASKYSTTFVFLLGIVAFFDKWVLDNLKWPDFPLALPSDMALSMAAVVGLFALLTSAAGWFLTNHVIKLRPIVSRPLNQEILDFFENQPLLNIYYGFARENSKAYVRNKEATDRKYAFLKWAYNLMKLVLALLAVLIVMYCLHSWY
jgi:hypothetical protein